jgi:hypothetical protein
MTTLAADHWPGEAMVKESGNRAKIPTGTEESSSR